MNEPAEWRFWTRFWITVAFVMFSIIVAITISGMHAQKLQTLQEQNAKMLKEECIKAGGSVISSSGLNFHCINLK